MPRCGHIALAGKPNAGKSSLLNALVGEPLAMVSAKPQATRLPVVGLRTEADVQYVFHDLPGLLEPGYLLQDRMLAFAIRELHAADLILHLHPAPDGPAPPLASMVGLTRPPRGTVLEVYTKADLLPPEQRGRLPSDAVLVSAATGAGLPELLALIAAHLPDRPADYPADDLGVQPVRFFAAEYLREAAFELLSDELPYAFTAEIEEFREGSDPVYIRAALFVERESQKRILIGAKGRTIKAIGRHARIRLEQLLGTRVFLETRVKVLPGWRKSPDLLTRFGMPDVSTGGAR